MKGFEKIMRNIFIISSLVSVVSIIVISVFIFKGGLPFLEEYGLFKFISGQVWSPSNSPSEYGIFPMILGTLYVTGGAWILQGMRQIRTCTVICSARSLQQSSYFP